MAIGYARGAAVAVAFAVLTFAGLGGSVSAQQALKESVRLLPRTEFSPVGLELDRLLSLPGRLLSGTTRAAPERPNGPLASFNVLPRARITTEATDNLFRSDDNETEDIIVTVSPEVRVVSDWTRHAVGVGANASIGRHVETAREDFEDWELTGSGRLDVTDDLAASGTVGFRRQHEARGEVDDPGEDFDPTIFGVLETTTFAEFRREGGFQVRPWHRLRRFRFEDNGAIDNSDRDRDEHRLQLRLGYETLPDTVFFVEPALSLRRYDRRFDDNGFQRDSDGYEVLAGVNWDASGVTYAEIAAGYFRQTFEDSRFEAVGAPIVRGRIVWNATPVLTIDGQVDRRMRETTTPSSAGTLDTTVQISGDWEAQHNLIVSGGYRFRDEQFKSSTDASQQTHLVAGGVEWLINRYLSLQIGANHTTRRATRATSEYDATSVFITLRGQL